MKIYEIRVEHEGELLSGTFRDVSKYVSETKFLVSFEDGYENRFYIPDDCPDWCEQNLGFTELAKNVGAAIQQSLRMSD